MINSYIFAILKLIFYYLFIVLKFILLHFLPSITSCLFLCFKKTPLLRSYAARCNFIPIGHGIPLAEKKPQDRRPKYRKNCVSYLFTCWRKTWIHCRHHHPHRLSSSPASSSSSSSSSSSLSSMKQVSVIRLALYPSRSRVANEVVSLFLKLSIRIKKSRHLKYQGNIFLPTNENLWHISSFFNCRPWFESN